MTKIIIYVHGGLVREVRASESCEVEVWDQDNIESGDEAPLDVPGYYSEEIKAIYPVVEW
jgi:hypothetical protein